MLTVILLFTLGAFAQDVDLHTPNQIGPDGKLVIAPPVAKKTCSWCVFGNAMITAKATSIANLSSKGILQAIRAEGACVKIMDTRRRVAKGTFAWSQIEKPTLKARDVSKIAGLMGKTLCKDELPIARACPTIVLASDAPLVTAIHEYLHYLQSKRDAQWCSISKKLWREAPAGEDLVAVRDKEWDAHLFLWYNRSKMNLAVGDRIAIASEILSEAEQRKRYDPDAEVFLKRERPELYLQAATLEYKQKMEIKK